FGAMRGRGRNSARSGVADRSIFAYLAGWGLHAKNMPRTRSRWGAGVASEGGCSGRPLLGRIRPECAPMPQARPGSATRVMLAVQSLQMLARHQRIDLGGGQRTVAKQHLQGAQVGAAIEQMGGETVAQAI